MSPRMAVPVWTLSKNQVAITLLSHGTMLYLTEHKVGSSIGPRSLRKNKNGFSDRTPRSKDWPPQLPKPPLYSRRDLSQHSSRDRIRHSSRDLALMWAGAWPYISLLEKMQR